MGSRNLYKVEFVKFVDTQEVDQNNEHIIDEVWHSKFFVAATFIEVVQIAEASDNGSLKEIILIQEGIDA